jgi:hypothetical protein
VTALPLNRQYSPYQLGYAAKQRGRSFSLMPWLKRAGSVLGPAISNWSSGDKPLVAVGKALKQRLTPSINSSAPPRRASKGSGGGRGGNKKRKKKGFRKIKL